MFSGGLSRQRKQRILRVAVKLKHGHLRLDSIHTLRHHPGTKTKFHWPLFLISSQTGRELSHKNTDTTQVGWIGRPDELLGLPSTMLSSERESPSLVSRQNVRLRIVVANVTLGSLKAPVSDIATHCSALGSRRTGRWDFPKEYRYTPSKDRYHWHCACAVFIFHMVSALRSGDTPKL